MDRWQNKVAIVTGASSGIGAAICEELVKYGLKVVGLARRNERVEDLAKKLGNKPGKLYAFKADITKEDDIIKAFQWVTANVGLVHVLINNAGILRHTNLLDGKTNDWKSILDTNVMGLCIATREAGKIMKENKIDGHIIHINSIAGHIVPVGFPTHMYGASKYAVTSLTEALRQELNAMQLKIKITSISPGYVKTEIFEQGGIDIPALLGIKNGLESKDIADIVCFVLGTPPHVQINEIIVRPTDQTI